MRKELRFLASRSAGEVSAILLRPAGARCLLVLGHGAGAGMAHPFLEKTAVLLAEQGVATLRYQFPYMEAGRRRPDFQPVLLKTVAAAISEGRKTDLPLFAGGKSMGGRMTSLLLSRGETPNVRGVVFFGFPLHPAGKPGTERGEHLRDVAAPMLFLQGTRDKLADLELLRPICEELGERATLHVVSFADHSFSVLKSSGREAGEVLSELVETSAAFLLARSSEENPGTASRRA